MAVFEALIAAYSDAVSAKNDDGDLTIHISAANEAPEEVLMLLIDACPEALREAAASREDGA